MKIVAIVVTYNRKKLLEECVNAILSQSKKVSKIIIIDNNSTDNTYEYLSDKKILNNDLISYKKLEKNIGGAGGFYEGFKESQNFKPDWLWIMDDDTIPSETCLENLLLALNKLKNEKVSFLASSIYGEKGEFMNVPNINTSPSNSGYPDWYKYLEQGIVKISEATFVSLLINNEAVKEIGYPVRDYFIWGDDTEYTLRLNKYYGNSYLVGKSIAIHKRKITKKLTIKEEKDKNRLKFHYYMIRNNLINQKTYYGKKKFFIFLFSKQLESIKILFDLKCKNKFLKFITIHKGICAYIFRRYNYKAFKNRMDIDAKYL